MLMVIAGGVKAGEKEHSEGEREGIGKKGIDKVQCIDVEEVEKVGWNGI